MQPDAVLSREPNVLKVEAKRIPISRGISGGKVDKSALDSLQHDPSAMPLSQNPQRNSAPTCCICVPREHSGRGRALAFAVGDSAFGEIVGRNLQADLVPRNDADEILTETTREVGCHVVTVFYLHPTASIGNFLLYRALDFNGFFGFFRHGFPCEPTSNVTTFETSPISDVSVISTERMAGEQVEAFGIGRWYTSDLGGRRS